MKYNSFGLEPSLNVQYWTQCVSNSVHKGLIILWWFWYSRGWAMEVEVTR